MPAPSRLRSRNSSRLFLRCVAVLPVPVLCLLAVLGLGGGTPPPPYGQGALGLGLALRRLGVTGSVLYVTAHPDDENNGVLVMLRKGLGLRTALLTLTRGEGGQNGLGPELFDELGVLRTEELASIHRYDDAEQYFTRAYDFGYSFSVEESFEKWGHQEVLSDVVRVLRAVRPDVVLTLPVDAVSGGLHHQAAARLAREAFRAAADPTRFPEQLVEGLEPWQARAIYQAGVGGGNEKLPGALVRVDTGAYDPLLGMSWAQLGSLARAQHRSQGASQFASQPGEGEAVYALLDSEPPLASAGKDLLEGVDTSFRGLLRSWGSPPAPSLADSLGALEEDVRAAREAYDPRAPERTLPPLRAGLRRLRSLMEQLRARRSEPPRAELLSRLSQEEQDFEDCLALAHGLVLDPISDDDDVVPGESFDVTTRVWNAGSEALGLDGVTLRVPEGWTVSRVGAADGSLGPGQARVLRDHVIVSPAASPTQPLWRGKEAPARYAIDPRYRMLPSPPPELTLQVRFTSGDVASSLERPVTARQVAGSGGEKRKRVAVVPALSVFLTPRVSFLPGRSTERTFQVRVVSHARRPVDAVVGLETPPECGVTPKETRVALRGEGQEARLSFRVSARRAISAPVELRAVALADGRAYREGLEVVAYDHIQERHLLTPAVARGLPGDIRISPSARVGYVASGLDTVDDVIRQLGIPVTLLAPADLSGGELSGYSTIVTGVRAYESRRELRASHDRLLKYMEAGGHLVVQYNRLEFNTYSGELPSGGPNERSAPASSPFAPFPAIVGGNRVTAEEAPIRFLQPNHPLLTTPNRITSVDFDGWVQERGVNFLEARDPRYTELLAATDAGPANPGEKRGLLVEARVGRGSWTYVGFGLARQLRAGVPGAYRILANLVSRARMKP